MDIAPNPVRVTPLCSDGIMLKTHHLPDLVHQFKLGIGNDPRFDRRNQALAAARAAVPIHFGLTLLILSHSVMQDANGRSNSFKVFRLISNNSEFSQCTNIVKRHMKAFLTLGVAIGLYCGTYFLFVSHIDVGFSSMGTFWVDSVVPAYWRAPEWLHAAAFYKPIHVVDEKCLRHST